MTPAERTFEFDIFQQIQSDHRVIRQEFEGIAAAPHSAVRRRERFYGRLRNELKAHSAAEDKVLYPFLQRGRETAELAVSFDREHDTMDDLVERIDSLTSDTSEWHHVIEELKAEFDQHVAEEEGDLFAKMRRGFSDAELSALGERFSRARWEERARQAA